MEDFIQCHPLEGHKKGKRQGRRPERRHLPEMMMPEIGRKERKKRNGKQHAGKWHATPKRQGFTQVGMSVPPGMVPVPVFRIGRIRLMTVRRSGGYVGHVAIGLGHPLLIRRPRGQGKQYQTQQKNERNNLSKSHLSVSPFRSKQNASGGTFSSRTPVSQSIILLNTGTVEMTVLLRTATGTLAGVFLGNRLIGHMDFRGFASPVRIKMDVYSFQTRNKIRFNSARNKPVERSVYPHTGQLRDGGVDRNMHAISICFYPGGIAHALTACQEYKTLLTSSYSWFRLHFSV